MHQVILACHNRRETTLRCLRSLKHACREAGQELDVVLYDDGSTDGTSDAVAREFPHVDILHGDGHSFWAKSMSVAHEAAAPKLTAGDLLVWLNDDVQLDPDALLRVNEVRAGFSEEEQRNTCLVGAMRDPTSGRSTYSGFVRVGWHPLSFRRRLPGDVAKPVETFNGNFVVLPAELVARTGGIDGDFAHALADIDYGLRVAEAGGDVLLLPGTYGTCPENPVVRRGILAEWRAFTGIKGGGHRSSVRRFVRKHEPAKWPAAYALTVLAWWARKLSGRR